MSVFLQACRREPTSYTPIWIMRQAGRYQPEYRALREKVSFIELCKTPDLACEVTVRAVDQLGVDAGIIFADILLILEPLKIGFEFTDDHGPKILNPIRTAAQVDGIPERIDAAGSLSYVMDAIRNPVDLRGRTNRIQNLRSMIIGELEADLKRLEDQQNVGEDDPRIHTKLIDRSNRHLTSKLRRLAELDEANPLTQRPILGLITPRLPHDPNRGVRSRLPPTSLQEHTHPRRCSTASRTSTKPDVHPSGGPVIPTPPPPRERLHRDRGVGADVLYYSSDFGD